MNNKIMTIAPIILVAILIMMTTPLLTQQSVSAKKMSASDGPSIPFSCTDAAGTNCHDDVISNAPAVSNSKAESASSADSQNNVKCFAFCLGISNANSGSAADSNSRTNSPGNTATAQPVSPQSTTIDTTVGRPFTPSFPVQQQPHHTNNNNNNNHHSGDHPITNDPFRDNGVVIPPPSAAAASVSTSAASITGVECIDNTGSAQDSGYAQGYVDGNRDSAGLNGHGFDDSLHGNHTPEFRQGYHDGYLAGWHDGNNGINLQPC